MKKILSVILLCIISSIGFAQANFPVFGKVVDSATRQPLAGASAFCQNTTYGTISNNEGLFYMRLPAGGYDLIVSYTGYEKRAIRISNNQSATDTILVELTKQDKTLLEVAVVGSNEVPDGWNKYGKFFMDNFIGTTPNSQQCQLKNPEALRFFYTKKRNRLKVMAKEDLNIMNYALGYTIRYQLDSFSYDYNTNISQFTGYPFFIEIDTSADIKTEWSKNRARTYLGSRLHFMRAYYDSILTDQGFLVEKMEDDPRSIKGNYIDNVYDSTFFRVDSNNAVINWNGRYRISYKKVFPDKKFLEEFNLPADTRVQVTLLDIADGFVIEKNGYFYDQYDVVNTGYWSWKKLAELLPYDYKYE